MTVTVQTACQTSFLNPIIFNRQVSKCRWSQESDNGDPNGQYADYYIRSDTISAKERKDINLRNKEGYPQCMLISEWGNPQKSIPAGSNIDFEIFLPDLIPYRLHPSDKIG